MQTVECRTLYNERKRVPIESLLIRPSAYAIIVHDGRMLLLRSHDTRKWMQPGGGIEKGEHIEQALKRELLEEAGLEIKVGNFAHFEEDFFYYDPLDLAIQGYLFFYYCTAKTDRLHPPQPKDEEGEPAWVDIHTLSPDDFQTHGDLILQLARQI